MKNFGQIVIFGMLGATLVAGGFVAGSAEARCCSRVSGGCDSASETGCAMGSSQNMFFDDPCVCQSEACVDPTQANAPCGGQPPAQCGDGVVQSPEDCDDGSENGSFESCCAMDCTYKSNGATCDDGTFCDGFGACDGAGTCDENNGPPSCPDEAFCNEASRTCDGARAPTTSTGVLIALASMMLAGAFLTLRRRRRLQQN